MEEHRCNIIPHLCSAGWSESKPLKVAELFSAFSYQRTCNFCGFTGRSELTTPCAYQGDTMVMQEIVSAKTPTGTSPSPAHLRACLTSVFIQKMQQK